MSALPGSGTAVRYSERLWPPVSWWIVTALLSAMTAAMVYPVWEFGALVVPIVVFVLAAAWLRSMSSPVVVTGDALSAGPARIDRRFVAEAIPYDERDSFVARGAELDARAYLMIRPWVKTVVKVVIDDREKDRQLSILTSLEVGYLRCSLRGEGKQLLLGYRTNEQRI